MARTRHQWGPDCAVRADGLFAPALHTEPGVACASRAHCRLSTNTQSGKADSSVLESCNRLRISLRPTRPKRRFWKGLPFALAFLSPARARSTIKLRSNSATAPKTVNTILPAGVAVSIVSLRETKWMLSEPNVSSTGSRCETERAIRSNFQTATTSKRRRCAATIKRSSSDRFSFVPEMPTSTYARRLPPTALDVLPKLARLHGGVLSVVRCAYPRVDRNPHLASSGAASRRVAASAAFRPSEPEPACRLALLAAFSRTAVAQAEEHWEAEQERKKKHPRRHRTNDGQP